MSRGTAIEPAECQGVPAAWPGSSASITSRTHRTRPRTSLSGRLVDAWIISWALRPVRPGLPRLRSRDARLPEAAAVEEQVNAIGPGIELDLGHRRAVAEGAVRR